MPLARATIRAQHRFEQALGAWEGAREMRRDDSPPRRRPGVGAGEPAPRLAPIVELANQLARTPNGSRDLAWHVEAFYVGDLTALVAAALRAPAAA